MTTRVGAAPVAAVATLGLLLVAGLGSACGGTCEELAGAYQDQVRRNVARVGPGLEAIGGSEVHLGVTLSEEFVQQLRGPISAQLPPLETRLSAGDRTERRAAVEIRARAVVERLELIGSDERLVGVHLNLETHVVIRRPGVRSEHTLSGTAIATGALTLSKNEDGSVTVDLLPVVDRDDEGRAVLSIEQSVEPLTGAVAETVREFVETRVAQLMARLEPVPLIRFPPVSLGPLVVRVAPASLVIYPDDKSLFVGLLTNLRPLSRGGVRPESDVSGATVRFFFHPGLPAAAARLALSEGGILRRYGDSTTPDPDGGVVLTLDDLELTEEGFDLTFQAWRLDDSCAVSAVRVRGEAVLDKGTVSLVIESVEVEGGGAEEVERWRDSSFVQTTLALVERVVNRNGILLGDGRVVSLRPVELRFGAQRVEVLAR